MNKLARIRDGQGASIVVPSAESTMTYRGAEGDIDGHTLRWLDVAFASIQEQHSIANEACPIDVIT